MTKSGAPTVSAGELPSGRPGRRRLAGAEADASDGSPHVAGGRQDAPGHLQPGRQEDRPADVRAEPHARDSAGRHSLRANNTLVWRTVEFDAEPGAEIQYRCVNRAPESLYFMLFIFGVAPLYVTLERGAPPEG